MIQNRIKSIIKDRKMIQNRMDSREKLSIISFLTFSFLIPSISAKGGASRGVSASGGGSGVCTDCAGVDTEGEIQASLIVVAIIFILFLTVCSCQCYQKFSWELRSRPTCTSDPDSDKKPMPMAPYTRDAQRNNNTTVITSNYNNYPNDATNYYTSNYP